MSWSQASCCNSCNPCSSYNSCNSYCGQYNSWPLQTDGWYNNYSCQNINPCCNQYNACNTCIPCIPYNPCCPPTPVIVTYSTIAGTTTTVPSGTVGVPPTPIPAGSTTIPAGTVTVITGFGAPLTNVGGITVNSSTGQFTVPVAGRYLINANVIFEANAVGTRELYIYKVNATTGVISLVSSTSQNATAVGTTNLAISAVADLGAGDRIFFAVTQNSGVPLTTSANSTFSITRIN